MKALSLSTHTQYLEVMRRATGKQAESLADYADVAYDYSALTGSMRLRFKAALRRAWEEAGDEARGIVLAKQVVIPPVNTEDREPIPWLRPEERIALEKAAEKTATPARLVLIKLMLRLGLRVNELLSLSRKMVELAATTGELPFIRKGGGQQILPTAKVIPLLEELLATSRMMPNGIEENEAEWAARQEDPSRAVWQRVREVVSIGKPKVAYNMMWRALDVASRAANGRHFSPHWLRRMFATKMREDGADIYTIQKALGHRRTDTTLKYIKDDNTDILKHMR